jgi:hypothetical protein
VKRPHKYKAVRTEVDGVMFASKAEARRYQELRLLEKAGHVERLTMQPSYDLMVISSGLRTNKIGEYRADFSYYDVLARKHVIEDVKGFKTPLYRWKKKHVEAQYGIEIREVR